MIYTAPANASSQHEHAFYINHRVQTSETALWYLAQVRAWMDVHPTEIIRIHISRHAGSTFPFTPNSALRAFFADFTRCSTASVYIMTYCGVLNIGHCVSFSDSSNLFFSPLFRPPGVTSIFNGLFHNHTRFPSATTTIGELLAHDQRLLASIADYDNVTSGHPDAKDYMNEDVR